MPAPYDYALSTGYDRARADWIAWPTTTTLVRQEDLDRWDQAIYDLKRLIYNVKDWGAKGDDVTDDTAAIAAAISAAGNNDCVLFPSGTYIVSCPSVYTAALTAAGTKVTFLGVGGAILKASATTPIGIRMLSVTGNDVVVEGLEFDPNGITDATCVFLTNASRVRVRNNLFTNPKSGGVHMVDGVFDLTVQGNTFNGAGYGVLASDPATGGRWKIVDNTFVGGVGDGIELNCPTTGIADVLIAGNQVSGYTNPTGDAGFGIGLSRVSRALIVGNHVSSCSRPGIHTENRSNDVTITGNTVHSCEDSGIEIQTAAGQTTENISITGNIVYNCCLSPTVSPTGLGKGGIQIGWINGGSVYGATVVGNISRNNKSSAAGIFTYESRHMILSANACMENTGAGIDVTSSVSSVITGNRCFDLQGTKTQTYGLKTFGSGAGCKIGFNQFENNLTGEIDNGFSTAPDLFLATKPTVSGSRGGNAALADLLTELATLGIVTDSSSA